MFSSFLKSGIRAVYNVSENPTFIAEPWSVYPAKHKTTGKIVSVFIFDKTKIESQIQRLCSTSSNSRNPKVLISECYELIKYEVNQLSKLRHPQILTILEVLEETKTKFIFASESVGDNLLTINEKELDSLTIQKGLLQIAKGLQFLHSNCSIIHLNLQPSSIFINQHGDWKLAGFKFLQNLNEISPQDRDNFYIMNNSSLVPFSNLNLNFTAPELIIDSHTQLDFNNDIWSFGMLIYFLYNHECLINCFDSGSISDYKTEFKKFERKFYNHQSSELRYLLKSVPDNLQKIFPKILARYPHDRMTLNEFIDSDYFNGSVIKAMWFIDEFSTKSVDEKLTFLKGLIKTDPNSNTTLISQFPATFRLSKLLPLLVDVVINELNVPTENSTDDLISSALLIILKTSETMSQLTFQDKVYDALLKDNSKNKKNPKVFSKLINSSVLVRLTLIENLKILQDKLHDKQFVSFIKNSINLIFNSKDVNETQITLQETFLKYLPNFVEKIDFPYMKNSLFPLLCQSFKTTTVLSTKVTLIETFESFIDHKVIDKIIVNDQLFPIMKNLKSRDKRIVEKALCFYQKLIESQHINLDIDICVEDGLSHCLSLCFGCNDCSQTEFKKFHSIVNKIEKQLMERKLESLPRTTATTSGSNNGNFESLIHNQTIIERPRELPGPKSETLKPKQKKNVSTKKPVKQEITLQPRKAANKKPINLTFGATNTNTNTNTNDKLMNSLKSTFDKIEDDDFDDFQSANATIKSNTMPNNYPPGFNSHLVLSPSHSSANATKTNNNESLLDLI